MLAPRNMTDRERRAFLRTIQSRDSIETSCHPWWRERVEIYVLVTVQVDDLAQNQCHWIAQFCGTGDIEWIGIGLIGGQIIVLYDKSIRALSDNNPSKNASFSAEFILRLIYSVYTVINSALLMWLKSRVDQIKKQTRNDKVTFFNFCLLIVPS